ncbi:VPLPA-CTERM sorting domain-containing protein [Sedimentitalea arenosa]|nr:VPLPA-CTERM sorting domain-containing protein [Arenibacterium arenosum]
MKTLSLSIAALMMPLAAAAATLNLDSEKPGGNAGLLYKDAGGFYLDANDTVRTDNSIVYLSLAAGTYNITPTKDLYESWSRWSANKNCDNSGENCTQGFEQSFAFFMVDTATAGADGRVGDVRSAPTDNSLTNLVNYSVPFTESFFATPGQGYDAVAGTVMASFTLDTAQDVGFYIHDNWVADNRGGVSINVAAVPLPAGLPLLLAGLGGLALVRRKSA